jgi:putative oxidoreductase
VIVNIVCFHAFMDPAGLPMAIVVAVLWFVAYLGVRPAFAGLLQPRATPRL